jgi:hypothetical protein
MAMMTMVPVRVLHFPHQFSIKAALPVKHPSDYLEFDQFKGGYPPRPLPSWNPSDALEYEQFAEGYPPRPKPSWNPSDALEFDQFAGGYPARAKPSWNPSDALEFDQFAEGYPARAKPSWNPSDALEFDQFAEGYPARAKPSWNPSDALPATPGISFCRRPTPANEHSRVVGDSPELIDRATPAKAVVFEAVVAHKFPIEGEHPASTFVTIDEHSATLFVAISRRMGCTYGQPGPKAADRNAMSKACSFDLRRGILQFEVTRENRTFLSYLCGISRHIAPVRQHRTRPTSTPGRHG